MESSHDPYYHFDRRRRSAPPCRGSAGGHRPRRAGAGISLWERIFRQRLTKIPPLLLYLQSWLAEDATDNPDDIHQAQAELEAFKQAINAERERAGARRIYP